MVDVNWDDVAQEADDSPRSILAEWLGRVDEVESVIVIIKEKKDIPAVTWSASTKDGLQTLGMLEFCKYLMFQDQSAAESQ